MVWTWIRVLYAEPQETCHGTLSNRWCLVYEAGKGATSCRNATFRKSREHCELTEVELRKSTQRPCLRLLVIPSLPVILNNPSTIIIPPVTSSHVVWWPNADNYCAERGFVLAEQSPKLYWPQSRDRYVTGQGANCFEHKCLLGCSSNDSKHLRAIWRRSLISWWEWEADNHKWWCYSDEGLPYTQRCCGR